ncbi:MAG: amidohydrolase [Clostridia bacterium]|nr:amidohydrolase [Clostridia bacterium]
MKIIDAHCHIFPDKLSVTATQNTQKFYDIPHTAYYGSVNSLLEQCEQSGVSQCVVAMVATNPRQPQKLSHFVADQMKLHPDRFIGFGAVHPESKTLTEDVKLVKELNLKGIKTHPDIQGFKADCDGYKKIYDLCSELNIPVLMHTGDSRYDNSNPDRIANILENFPKLTVIGAHFGGWSLWQEAAEKLHKYDNFFVDTCSSLYLLSDTDAKKIINKYGEDKVIFGSDYPIWKQADEIERFLSFGYSDQTLEKIFAKNIEGLLKI